MAQTLRDLAIELTASAAPAEPEVVPNVDEIPVDSTPADAKSVAGVDPASAALVVMPQPAHNVDAEVPADAETPPESAEEAWARFQSDDRVTELLQRIRETEILLDSSTISKINKSMHKVFCLVSRLREDPLVPQLDEMDRIYTDILVKYLNGLLRNGFKRRNSMVKVRRAAAEIIKEDLKLLKDLEPYGNQNARLCFVVGVAKYWCGGFFPVEDAEAFPQALIRITQGEVGTDFDDLRRACYTFLAYLRREAKDGAGATAWENKLSEVPKEGGDSVSGAAARANSGNDLEALAGTQTGDRLRISLEEVVKTGERDHRFQKIYGIIVAIILVLMTIAVMVIMPVCGFLSDSKNPKHAAALTTSTEAAAAAVSAAPN